MAKTLTLFTYGIIATFLITFGFYTSTMNYAHAVITSSTFTTTTYDLRGSTYNDANNSWYFASPNNGTMIRLPNNTTTPTSLPVNGNSNCVDPIDIQSLEFADDAYIALWCDNGAVATHGLMIRDRVTNEEKDFEANIFNTEDAFTMAEWEGGDKLYVVNHGSSPTPSIAIFNLQAINSTTSTMFAGSISMASQCPTVYNIVINEEESEMYVTCTRVTTNVNTIAVVSLLGSVVTQYVDLTGTSGTLTIDYNTVSGGIAVADYTNNDFWLVDSSDFSLDYTNTAFCATGAPISPTFNENTNQVYAICSTLASGANAIALFDVPTTTVVATFTGANSPAGTQGGTNYWIRQHFEASVGRLYASFGWTQNGGSGAVANSLTTISDDSSVPSGGTTGLDCDLPENANILICRLGGDGTLGSAGAFVIGNTTQGTGILGIGCSIGLVDCTDDPDPRTNGLGLLIFIASIFVIVGMFYRSLGASATFQLPVFIWVVIIVALSAFFTITSIIDPIFLILSIVAVIALAVPKVIGVIQNRSFGGGGSTE